MSTAFAASPRRYAPYVLTVIGQFLVSTAGVALLVAIARAFAAMFADRAPRKRVDAIKAAHETAELLDGEAAILVRRQRDHELAALNKGLDRSEARSAFWARFSAPFRDAAFRVMWVSFAVMGVALAVALFGPVPPSVSGPAANSVWTWIANGVAAIAAVVTYSSGSAALRLRERQQRARRAEARTTAVPPQ